MKEVRSSLSPDIIKEWVWIAIEIMPPSPFGGWLFVICLPRAREASLRGYLSLVICSSKSRVASIIWNAFGEM
jgi:hypothetical protein